MAEFRLNQTGNSWGVSHYTISGSGVVNPSGPGPTMYFEQLPAGYEGQVITACDYYAFVSSAMSNTFSSMMCGNYSQVLWCSPSTGWQRWLSGATTLVQIMVRDGGTITCSQYQFSAYTESSAYPPYLIIGTQPQEFSIIDRYPAAGAQAVRTLSNRFGWALSVPATAALIGSVLQATCTFQWRAQGSGTINSRSVPVSGATGYVDIPAGTFTADNIEWRVVITSNGGYTVASGWILINTTDSLSTAVAVSPNAVVVEDVTGITFQWKHNINTGLPPTGFQIQASSDQGGTWTTLAEQTGSSTSYRAPHNAVPSGPILWRVRTRNNTGTYGSWSAPVGVVVRVAPDTPSITYADTKPRVTVRWQSANQQAYQVRVLQDAAVVFDSGMLYGATKELRAPRYLLDGVYTVQVRIQNDSGLVSGYAAVMTTVANHPGEAFQARTRFGHAAVHLAWDAVSTAQRYYVLRDDVPIAMLLPSEGQAYSDYFCCGTHEYKVMAVDANDYYTLSDPAVEKSLPRFAMLVPVSDPENWLLLKWEADNDGKHRRSAGYIKEYITYQGREKPVGYISPNKSVVDSFSYRFINRGSSCSRRERKRLEELDGAIVLYKSRRGDRYFGTLDSLHSANARFVDMSFEIVETDYSEEVEFV